MKKEIKYYIITALITSTICFILYIESNAFQNTILISDAYSQYAALFTYLRDALLHGKSLVYSFSGGLGNGFLGTFFYYLASPFNLLLIFFQDINHFFLTIILLKMIGISLSSLYFFRYHFRKEIPLYSVTFSIIYTFIGFNVLYFFHIMWLDVVLLLPLLLVGIDQLIKKRKFGLYVLSLMMIIITNYYFGYMTCIFSFLYFNYQIFLQYSIKKEWKTILKENIRFILISLLGVFTTSFVLLEIIHYLPGYARTTTEFLNGEAFIFQTNPLEFFQYFLIGSTENVSFLNSYSFYLYMSIFTILLNLLYFFNCNIKRKEKWLTLGIIGILYLSTAFNYINYAWSGFSKPQYFNGRFTFFFNFFLLITAMKSLINLSYLRKKDYLLSAAILLIPLIMIYFKQTDRWYLYINISFFITYFLLLYFIHSKKIHVPLLLSTIICIEITSSALISQFKYSFTSKEEYDNQNIVYEYITDYIQTYDDSEFYRIETSDITPYNGPIYYSYYGIDVFLSTLPDSVADFFIDIGYGSGYTKKNTISYYSGNEVIDSLLGIKYPVLIGNEDEIDFYFQDYALLDSKEMGNNTIHIYENKNALSLGFMVNSKILKVTKESDALSYQNNIFKAMTNLDFSIYTTIPLEEDDGNFYFQASSHSDICFYTAIDSTNGYQNPTLYFNYHKLSKIQDFNIQCVNDSEEEELAMISYTNLDSNQYQGTYAAIYSHDNFEKIIQNLQEQELQITSFQNNDIKGTVTSTSNKNILFTTIPYDDNWDVYVNGKKVKTTKILDTFLGVELEEGTFEIEFIYRPKQFYLGIVISILSGMLLWLYSKKKKILKRT